MASADHLISVYRELADWNDRQGQAQLRDRFLVLAADAALSGGRAEEAEKLRQHLLQRNPHHLLRPYTSLAQALRSPDVQTYVGDLRQSYPPDAAEHLLQSLRAEAGESGAAPEPSIEATLPVSQLPRPPANELPNPAETLRVYPVQSEAEEDDEEVTRTLPAGMPLVSHDKTVRQTTTTRPDPVAPTAPPPAVKKTVATAALSPAPPPKPRAQPVPQPKLAPPPPTIPVAAPVTPPRPARPTRPAETYGLHPESVPVFQGKPAEKDERDGPSGGWVPLVLLVLLAVAGLLLGAYTVLRPFLPAAWLR